jgi:5'-nucleotidase/UDP-sugar diphosphatase
VIAPAPPLADPLAERVIGRCLVGKDGAPDKRFLLLHTNDLQARYSEKLGGKSRFARLAGALAAERATTPNVLVLDGGDAYEKGSFAETLSSGEATREALQLLPFDARVIGNHDFAWGREQVLRDVRQSRFPVLAANIQYIPLEGQPASASPFLPYVRYRVGCVKVAVFGLVTAGFDARDEQVKGPYDTVFIHDDRYTTIAKGLVEKLRPDADVIIALDHLGLFPDSQLAQRVPGIDILISSHTEEFLENPNPVWRADGRTGHLVEAGHWTRAFGRGTVAVGPKSVFF